MHRGASGEDLPPFHRHIDISGVELDPAADAAGHFGRDQAGARAEKRIIDRLAGPAVVDDRAAHAFDRLLGAVPPALLALWAAERVVVGDLPDCRLRAVTRPVAGLSLAHRVPAGFVLPVIIAAAQGEVLLAPDKLGAQLQPAGGQTGGDDIAVQSPVPDIRDVTGEQRIGLTPVGAIIVEHLAPREFAGTEAAARPPGWIVFDPVRRIGDHQVRLRPREHRRDIGLARAVAAANPMRAQQPYVAEPRDRLTADFRDAVRIGQTARPQTGQDGFELIRLEADHAEIKIGELERLQFVTQQIGVPARARRQLIVGQPIGTLLLLVPTLCNNYPGWI